MSSFGEELRRERELRSISLREIAEATKVNLRYLEAIERNRFEELPGGVFNRGFVRAYAEFIGVDPEVMVNAYLLEEQSKAGSPPKGKPEVLRGDRGERRAPKTPSPTTSSPKETASAAARSRRRAKRARWGLVGLLVLVLLIVAALVLLGMWADVWPGFGSSGG